MFQELTRLLVLLYNRLMMLIVTAFLSVAVAAMWHFYRAEWLQNQFSAAGQPVTVQIEHTDRQTREVWDALGNFVYVGFTYHNQPYETRCVNDTAWLSAGDRITLLYHPQLKAFGQPHRVITSTPVRVVSRLIKWSVISEFSTEKTLLIGFLLAVIGLFFYGGGVIVTLTGWTFIQTIARFVLLIGLGAGLLFFTYDTVRYYQYTNELQTSGKSMEVVVANTDRHTHGRRKGHWYTYDATFRFNGQERVVPIEETDYDRLTTDDKRLTVRYNPVLNDFIAAGYSPGLSQLIMPVFFLLLLIMVLRPTSTRQNTVQPGRS